MFQHAGRVTRLYGTTLAHGADAVDTADSFLAANAPLFGTRLADLRRRPGSPAAIGRSGSLPMMYDRTTGDYRFSLVVYDQTHYGIPVFDADVRLLVANRAGAPLTLVASSLREVADFVPERPGSGDALAAAITADATATPYRVAAATAVGAPLIRFSPPRAVIWAGVDSAEAPREAITFIADNFARPDGNPIRARFVADADTGAILHSEDLIQHDVSGTVRGLGTPGHAASECADEIETPLPYATLTSGGTTVHADADGAYSITDSSGESITITSVVSGLAFSVSSANGPSTTSINHAGNPGDVVDFLHNPDNTEIELARINGYVDANRVRDWLLGYHPSYPQVADQTDFPVIVNRDDFYCPGNAWYDPDEVSLNFCMSGNAYGDDYSNSAFGSIIYHEYGHHLVDAGGSGQNEYGEGMGDVVAALVQDDPGLADGFFLDQCGNPLRTADNACMYDEYNCSSCGWESHDCGNLLSGAVWSIRTEMGAAYPEDALDIVSNLAVNSILLHSGGSITFSIPIDFLTLDDDDGDLDTGSPHWTEICAGFEAHDLSCPPLVNLLSFTLPERVTEGDGVLSGQGQVHIVVAPTSDRVVTLTSSDESELQLPATVTIPSGELSATFDLTVVDDDLLDGSQSVTIDGSAPSAVPGSGHLIVDDDETATLTLSIPTSATEGDGVLSGQGSVTASAATDEDVMIELTSSDPTELQVPATAVIPSGNTTVTFDLTVIDDDLFDATQNVTVTATVVGWTGDSAGLAVADNEQHQLTITVPASVAEDDGVLVAAGTVSIPGRMADPLVIDLASSDTGLVTVPAQVTIPAMTSSVSFPVTVVDDNLVEADATATLGASTAGFTGDDTAIEIRNDDVDHFVFGTITSPQEGGADFAIQIDGVDGDGDVVADYHKQITLTAAGDGGAHSVVPAATSLSAGQFAGNVNIPALDTNVVLTATDAAERTGSSNAFDLTAGPITRFELAAIGAQLSRAPFPVSVTARDIHGVVATGFTGVATISARIAPPELVLITEIDQGDTDEIELQNVSSAPIDVTGWRLVVSNSLIAGDAINPAPAELSGELSAGEVRYFTDNPTDNFYGIDIVWRDNSPGWALLIDDADQVVDVVVWGYDPAELAPRLGDTTFDFGAAFSGPPIGVEGTGTIQRRGQEDHDVASDFTRGTANVGATNPEMTLSFRPGILELTPAATASFTAGEWTGDVTLVGATDQAILTVDDGAGHVGQSLPFELSVAAACDPDPCQNGSVCVPVDDSYQCQCPDGYEGQNCDQDIDECATSTPCDDNATCTNSIGSYSCECNDGYSGDGTTCDVVCGDGETGPGEECDDGTANSDTTADACRTTCEAAHCGDGVIDNGEECDEGTANVAGQAGKCNLTCAIEVEDKGCGGCSTGDPGSWFLMLLVGFPLLVRRRRRVVATR